MADKSTTHLMATPSKDNPGITKTPPTPLKQKKSPEELKQDLRYLRDHKICEKLEFIVRHLLQNQPDDPILSVCNMLRESNRSRSSVATMRSSASSSVHRGSASEGAAGHASAAGATADRAPSKHGADGTQTGHDVVHPNTSRPPYNPTSSMNSSAVGSPTEMNSPQSFDGHNNISTRGGSLRGGRHSGAHSGGTTPLPSVLDSPSGGALQQSQTSSNQRNMVAGVMPTSRVGTPASVVNGQSGGLSRRDSLGKLSSGTGPSRLERDESARSETSVFSITSVDMGEFLAEFRSSHFSLFGNTPHDSINKQDLADIVDRVALPLPDVRMLVELFHELDDGSGFVSFEAFLARMNFKIQGKYPLETIRGIYFSLLPDFQNGAGGTAAVASINPASLQKYSSYGSATDLAAFASTSTGDSPSFQQAAASGASHTAASAAAATDAHSPSACESGANNQQMSSLQQQPVSPPEAATSSATLQQPNPASSPSSPSATDQQLTAMMHSPNSTSSTASGAARNITSASSSKNNRRVSDGTTNHKQHQASVEGGITRQQCLEDGLWRGLGIRITHQDFVKVTNQLGIPNEEDIVIKVSDFTRIVLSITGRDPLEMSEGL